MSPTNPSRRQFIQSASATIAAPVLLPSSLLGQSRTAPGNRITLGAIGMGSKGIDNLRNFLYESDVQVVAVCDVHDSHHRDAKPGKRPPLGRKPAKQIVEKHYAESTRSGTFSGCDAYADYRELCTREDIDAIMVATPITGTLLSLEDCVTARTSMAKANHSSFCGRTSPLSRGRKRGAIFQVGSQQQSQHDSVSEPKSL